MIQLRTKATDKVVELGGGANPMLQPNVDCRACYDAQGRPTVDIQADFNEPLPLGDKDFDGVLCRYALEHVSWRRVRPFLAEVFRILRPGGKAIFLVPNTEAQLRWIQEHPEGWDGKDFFDSASGVLFGDNDYPENTHRAFFSEGIARSLFQEAGFSPVEIQPYGERHTDMIIQAIRPPLLEQQANLPFATVAPEAAVADQTPLFAPSPATPSPIAQYTRKELFDKHYFNGGHKVGGYAAEGYRDFPVHEVTARHVLSTRPQSVLELGCGRGYILKRLQDKGVRGMGLEISRHCWLTRVCDGILEWDLCETPWPLKDKEIDLVFSAACLEHIPEEHIDAVVKEMMRVGQRCLHGIDFGHKDDGFDKTHCLLRDRDWWLNKIPERGPDSWRADIVDKELLEQGQIPPEVLNGNGKVMLNVGSYRTMYHGWINIDQHNLSDFAQRNGYHHVCHDVKKGLPYDTGVVDWIHASHFLEHLTYAEGLAFLKECRRVLKPGGAVRLAVPNAELLLNPATDLSIFDEINDECAVAPTRMAKVQSLLHSGHFAYYDTQTLLLSIEAAGLRPMLCDFRAGTPEILWGTLDMFPCLSLYAEGHVPA